MTAKEIILEIIQKPKYYKSKFPQSTASATVRSIMKGTAKRSTEEKFLEAFGYSKVEEAKYEKVK